MGSDSAAVTNVHTLEMFADLGTEGRARHAVLLSLAGHGDDFGSSLKMMDQLALLRAASLPGILDEVSGTSGDVLADVRKILERDFPGWRDVSAKRRTNLRVCD